MCDCDYTLVPGPGGHDFTYEDVRRALEAIRGGKPGLRLFPPFENWQLRRSGRGGWTIVDAEGRDITPPQRRRRPAGIPSPTKARRPRARRARSE